MKTLIKIKLAIWDPEFFFVAAVYAAIAFGSMILFAWLDIGTI